MPTPHRRIPVIRDPELNAALSRVARRYPGVSAARLVHDLAIRGAEAIDEDNAAPGAALGRLAALPGRDDLEWDVLERIDELAWGE